MASDVFTLQIILKAQDLASKELNKLEGKTGKFAKQAAAGGAAMTGAGVAIVGAFEKANEKANTYAKSIIQTQRLTGDTTEASSKLAFMYERLGVNSQGSALQLKGLSNQITTAAKAEQSFGFATKEAAKIREIAAGTTGKEHKALMKAAEGYDKAAEKAQAKSTALKELGVRATDAQGKTRPMIDIMRDVAEAYSKSDDKAKANAAAAKIFGRSFQKILPVLSGGAKSFDKITGSADKFGMVMGDKQLEDFKKYNGAMKDLEMAQKGVDIQMGLALQPFKMFIAEGIMKALAAFNKLDPGVRTFIISAGLIAGVLALVVGPILLLIGFLPAIAGGWAMVAGASFAAIIPVLIWVLAIMVVVGIAYLIIKNWKVIGPFFKKLWSNIVKGAKALWPKIVEAAKAALKFIINLIINLNPALFVIRHWSKIVPAAKKVWGAVKTWLLGFGKWLLGWLIKTNPLLYIIVNWKKIAPKAIGYLVKLKDGAARALSGLKGRIVNAIKGIPGAMVTFGRDLLRGLWRGIQQSAGWLLSKLTSWILKGPLGAIAKALGIASDSKVTTKMGYYLGTGLANGILSTVRIVSSASRALSKAATVNLSGGIGSIGSLGKGDDTRLPGGFSRRGGIVGSGSGAPAGGQTKSPITIILDGRELSRSMALTNARQLRTGTA